jgi:Zn-dependent protease
VTAGGPGAVPLLLCGGCGAALPASLLACPGCGKLVHAEELRALAGEAERAEQAGELSRALETWRRALALLPAASLQHQKIHEKVQALSALVQAAPAPAAGASPRASQAAPRTGWRKWAAGLGAVGVLLAKVKWLLLALLTKGKVLLVGLTQAKTFLSMIIAVGVYATVFGWRFALGLVASIYVHEMGHVVWLRRYGIAATAPMFIPGLGAFVRLKQRPATPAEDARVGLAGPVWGAAAAVGALALGLVLGRPLLLAVASVGAMINVFNLIPVWQLDGARGFAALSRRQRGWTAAVAWVVALCAHQVVPFLVALAATGRAASKGEAPERGDRSVFVTYVALLVGLTALTAKLGPMIRR